MKPTSESKKNRTPKSEAQPSNITERVQNPGSEPSENTADNQSFTIVAIGASAGGLEAFIEILQHLSEDTGMAYIFVQHLSPDHKSLLSTILSRVTKMNVHDIVDMESILPNNVYVIPYNKGIKITNGHIKLIPRSKSGLPATIDILFSSLAQKHKEKVIGIVLSGSANDGTKGLKDIKLAGGRTFAQDESAKFQSMPQSAIVEGVVDFVLSPQQIAEELNWIGKHPLESRSFQKVHPEDEIDNENPDLSTILNMILTKKNVDFFHYKMNTIKRRILRRMMILKTGSINNYAQYIIGHPKEIDLLYQDLLINVTEFFRDPDSFTSLKKTILPRIVESKKLGDTIRIWVAACATGEEVYSIAIMLLEIQRTKVLKVPFQIFASDLSAEAISFARKGEYSKDQLKNVSATRLKQFFVKTKDKYVIIKPLRDACIFAHHNILNDPPFSRIDLISCRNFLIYLDSFYQKKCINTFHFALNEGGFLMLGKSETIGSSAKQFTVINKKHKFYSNKNHLGVIKRTETSQRLPLTLYSEVNKEIMPSFKRNVSYSSNPNLSVAFDEVLLAQYIPASVIINYDLEILQFKGPTSSFLRNSSGRASFNILKMVNEEITFELRNAIHQAIKTKQTIKKTSFEMSKSPIPNMMWLVNIEVAPLRIENEEPLLIVVFTEQFVEIPDMAPVVAKNVSISKERRIKKLEEALIATKLDMSSIIHDQEATNQELQNANEEIISSNEELQSLNEELETSKEEIESTNEELLTSNQELNARILQIEELYTYYEGIFATVHEPVLILDKNIRIKSANSSFCKMFKVTEDDLWGISFYKINSGDWNIPSLRELLEDIIPKNIRFQDFELEQTFTNGGHKTLLLNAHRIQQKSHTEDLIVLTISDITEVKRLANEEQKTLKLKLEAQINFEKEAKKVIEKSNSIYSRLLMQSQFGFAILRGEDFIITLANDKIKEMWGKGIHVEGKSIFEVIPEVLQTNLPDNMLEVLKTGNLYECYEYLIPLYRNDKLENIYFNFVYQPYYEIDGIIIGIMIIAQEVTSQVLTRAELTITTNRANESTKIAESAMYAKKQFLAHMSHEILSPVNAIMGSTNVLLKTNLDNAQRKYGNAIKTAVDTLSILVNDLLELAKIDIGKVKFNGSEFDMEAALHTLSELFELKLIEKNLAFVKEYDANIPKYLIGDELRLKQIIMNLLSNAVKFTSQGKIVFRVRKLNETLQRLTLEFSITDTGIGIEQDVLPSIFNNFEEGNLQTKSSFGGTGLGLSIVKRLVELQDGHVFVYSKLGEGSTFGFVLDFDIPVQENVKA